MKAILITLILTGAVYALSEKNSALLTIKREASEAADFTVSFPPTDGKENWLYW